MTSRKIHVENKFAALIKTKKHCNYTKKISFKKLGNLRKKLVRQKNANIL